MTPKGSERHCVRELGSRLADAQTRIRDLENVLGILRGYIQNITLRALIDEALPREKPMT